MSQQCLSHYRFKECLKLKAEEYSYTTVHIVEDSFTSQTCTKCGLFFLCNNYTERKKCENLECNYRVDRDVNGSRNILLKYLHYDISEKNCFQLRQADSVKKLIQSKDV